jgi:Zn-dependent protease with chaperone function
VDASIGIDTAAPGLPATWFDGLTTQRRAVKLRLAGNALEVRDDASPGAPPRRYDIAALAPGERWRGAPLPLALPDGGTLWLDARAAPVADELLAQIAQVARMAPARPQRVARLIASWPAVLACLLCTVALVVWFDRQGAGLTADAALRLVPRTVDQTVGIRALEQIDKQWLASTQTPLDRRRAIEARFVQTAARLAPDLIVRLEFRRLEGEAGFNAFALPHGTVVVLDGMADEFSDDELMAVLGHEMGHVVHRHGMRSVLRSFGLLAVAGVVFGDFSTVAAGATAGLQNFSYSRDAEREADAYARRFIAEAGLPPAVLVSVWRKVLAHQQRSGASSLPVWLSTHPGSEERMRAAAEPNRRD